MSIGDSSHRQLARSAGTIGALTGTSRVLGFVRDLVIAAAFGTGRGAEAFVVSFRIPNLLRDLAGEGAANSAFVPVLTRAKEESSESFWRLVSTLFFIMTLVLAALCVLGIVLAPWIVRWMAPGFVSSADAEKFPLTVQLTRVIFPYIVLIGLSALAMGVLNSLKEFTSSSFGPILLNISMIAAGVFFEKHYGPMALVAGVLAGGVLQLGCQVPPLLKKGFRWTPPQLRDESLRRIAKLLFPRALGSALYQINIFVDSILASFESVVGPGGQSALYYSNRLFQLPLAVFGLSLAQALLPAFSQQMVKNDLKGFKETFSVSVRTLAAVVVPASAGLIVLAEPIVRILFERGRFDAYSTRITSSALFFYAFGLFSCCLIKILANAFYAMHDTRTPLKALFAAVGANVALSFLFMRPLQLGGLALASTLSATLNAFLLHRALRKKVGPLGMKEIFESLGKVLAASLVMAVACAFLAQAWLRGEGGRWEQTGTLFAVIGLSIAIYLAAARLFKVKELRKVFR